jgi:hypothetical protein
VKAIAKNDELALITLIDIAMDNGAEDVQENLSTDTEVEFQVRTGSFQVIIEMNIGNSLPAHRNHSVNSRLHCRLPASAKPC